MPYANKERQRQCQRDWAAKIRENPERVERIRNQKREFKKNNPQSEKDAHARYLVKLRADPVRLAKYMERTSRYRKAYMEKAKQDPERWKAINDSKRGHIQRLKADTEKWEQIKQQNRDTKKRLYHATPKPEKPKPVNMQPINVRAFKKPIAKRGRPRKPKKNPVRVAMLACLHSEGFTFTKLEVGLKRTCKACGRSFTEIPKPS